VNYPRPTYANLFHNRSRFTVSKALEKSTNIKYIPDRLKEDIVILLYKDVGLRSDANNYRGISLQNLVCKIILNRITPHIESKVAVCDEQDGFRKGRSCEHQLFTVITASRQALMKKSPLYLMFVDFSKAFDTVNRDLLWNSYISGVWIIH